MSTLPVDVRVAQGSTAGLVSRTVADAIDVVVVLAGTLIGYLGVGAVLFVLRPRQFHWPAPTTVDLTAWATAAFVLYLVVGWGITGRTIGKQVMGLRILRTDRPELTMRRASLRAVLYVIFPLGLLWCVFDSEGRSLQDIVVKTTVIYDWHRRGVVERAGIRTGRGL
jgi:uncharacterized RDD family membrane protein YckC